MVILGLQAPIREIRQKHTKDVTQLHRIPNPASHLQREPTRQSKLTNEALGTDIYSRGLTYQSPCKGRWSKAAMWGRPNPKFGRTWTGSQPPQPWKEGCHCLAVVGCQHSRAYLTREPTSPHYKRSLHTPSHGIHSSHHIHKEEEE